MEAASHRLFLGIPIPGSHLVPFKTLREQNREIPDIRWIPESNLHVTTYFFGNIETETMPNLIELIRLGLKKASSFELEFDKFCFAPKPKEPRMIWARYRKADAFKETVMEMDRLYSQIQVRQRIRKSPIPHVTLARLRNFKAMNEVNFKVEISEKKIEVTEMVLWESELTLEGARYRVVERFGV